MLSYFWDLIKRFTVHKSAVLAAPDKFRGSLTALEVTSAIKKAVEKKFNVKVSKVAISKRKGKAKQMTVKSNGRTIRTDGFAKSKKRAIVTLIDGYNIDLFSI